MPETTIFAGLEGRVAAVTGGGRGFGRAVALALAGHGAHVLVGSVSPEENEETVVEIRRQGGSARAGRLDVTRRQDCEAFAQMAVDHFGSLDIMICNAGVCVAAPALDTSDEVWQRTIDIDLTGAFNSAAAAGRRMIAAGSGGSVVLTSSNAAFVAFEGLAAYSAAKGAVNQLVRSLALEWGPHRIRVNAVAPGWTTHRMEGNEGAVDAALVARATGRTPLRRFGEVEEIVAPVLFLASSSASFITGTILPVDGGYTAG